MALYKTDPHTGVKDRHIKIILSVRTYSIDDFDAKVKVAVLQQRRDYETPQIKDFNLVTPEILHTCSLY